jgi:hypothetical protein
MLINWRMNEAKSVPFGVGDWNKSSSVPSAMDSNQNDSKPLGWGRRLAKASLVATVIAWVLGLAFSNPDPHLVPARVIADVVRAGFFATGAVFAMFALAEVLTRGTSGIMIAGLLGLGFNGLGVCAACRHLPDEIQIYRAGTAAADLRRAASGLDFQNLANPNLLKDKASLERQRSRVNEFVKVATRAVEALDTARNILAKPSSSDVSLDRKTAVIQDINGKIELCSREAKLAEAAVKMLDLLIGEWGRWKPGTSGPVFDTVQASNKHKALNDEMFAAEQSLAAGQMQILGHATIHPGERIVSVTTFNPPIPVQARTLQPSAPPVTPAIVPTIIDYSKLDLDNPSETAGTESPTTGTLTREDSMVMQSWLNVVSNLVMASREADRAAKSLSSADILNGATIARQGPVPVSQQFVNRRQIANSYGTAVHQWEQTVSTFSSRYLGQLYQSRVSPERANIERDRLNAAIADKLQRQNKICAMERDIALAYNRTVSTLETYQTYASPSPTQPAPFANSGAIPARPARGPAADASNIPANQYAKELAEQTANLQELQRSLYQLRQRK